MSRSSSQYPSHAYPDARSFKAKKRADLRAFAKAYEELRYGCAYFPNGEGEMGAIGEAIETLQKKLSAKEWGR